MKSVVAVAMSLALTFPAWAGYTVQAVLDDLRAEHGFPGATVAWTGGDGTVQTIVTGWADPDRGVPMTPETRMLAASIGKSFVAAAVLALQAEGALDLDDLLSRWLGSRPWFDRLPNHAIITLRHLLTHSGGLSDHVELPAFGPLFMSVGPEDPAPSPEDLVSLILDAAPLFAPGEGWSYSDTGYLLIGLVIEEASGMPWTEVVQDRFLQPLGLTDTEPSDRRDLARLAVGTTAMGTSGVPIRTVNAEGRMVWHPGIEGAGGGFVTTAADLARWGRLVWSGRVMPAAYLDAMLDGVPLGRETPGSSYGLAVSIDRTGAFGEVRGHGGWIPGYVSSLRYYPKQDVAIAIQINTDVGMLGDGGAFDGIERDITAAVLEVQND